MSNKANDMMTTPGVCMLVWCCTVSLSMTAWWIPIKPKLTQSLRVLRIHKSSWLNAKHIQLLFQWHAKNRIAMFWQATQTVRPSVAKLCHANKMLWVQHNLACMLLQCFEAPLLWLTVLFFGGKFVSFLMHFLGFLDVTPNEPPLWDLVLLETFV